MISTVISVYNTPSDWLSQAIQSILNQQIDVDFEIILVDDGSTNNQTIETLNKFKEYPNINVITLEENKGISFALNVGISNAKYDIIARMDSDDISLPNRFKNQLEYLQNHPEVDLIGSNAAYLMLNDNVWVAPNQSTFHPEVITKEFARTSLWFFNHPTVMFRKESVTSVGGYDESLKGLAEDYELWMRMLRNGKELRNLPGVDLLFRISPNSLTRQIRPENHEFQLKLQKSI